MIIGLIFVLLLQTKLLIMKLISKISFISTTSLILLSCNPPKEVVKNTENNYVEQPVAQPQKDTIVLKSQEFEMKRPVNQGVIKQKNE